MQTNTFTHIPQTHFAIFQVLHNKTKQDQYLTVATGQSNWAVRRSKDEVDAENDVQLGSAQGVCPKNIQISCGDHSGLRFSLQHDQDRATLNSQGKSC